MEQKPLPKGGFPQSPRDVYENFRVVELNRLALLDFFPDPVSVTASATLTAFSQTVFANATAGNVVLTAPAAADAEGVRYTVFKVDTSTNTVTIDGNILGGNAGKSKLTLVSDGTVWRLEMLYEEGTFQTGITGCNPTPATVTATYAKIGKVVTISLAGIVGTSNTTACTLTGVPSHLWPSVVANCPVTSIRNNGSEHPGVLSVGLAGSMAPFYYSTLTTLTSTFTNVGSKGLGNDTHITYRQ